jgi:hypothetical protein
MVGIVMLATLSSGEDPDGAGAGVVMDPANAAMICCMRLFVSLPSILVPVAPVSAVAPELETAAGVLAVVVGVVESEAIACEYGSLYASA